MKHKILLMIVVVIIFGMHGFAFADTEESLNMAVVLKTASFTDMPTNWSVQPLKNAVNNGLLNGYDTPNGKEIRPKGYLTRAEMAKVTNQCFGSYGQADLSGVSDVSAKAWYGDEMAKAVKMGAFQKDTQMRPNDKITRQEAFTVIARVFQLNSAKDSSVEVDNYDALAAFSDQNQIAAWAKDSINALVEHGYVAGSGGKIHPQDPITRAEFAKIMDNLVAKYIKTTDEASGTVDGNLMVNVPNTILKDMKIQGDLIIGDGVGDGDITLDNVDVQGRAVVRGGGIHSIHILGNTKIKNLVIAKVDGNIRVDVKGNAEVTTVFINDGKDEVIIEGIVQNLHVEAGKVSVLLQNAQVKHVKVVAADCDLTVDKASKVEEMSIGSESTRSKVVIAGEVTNVTVDAAHASVTAEATAKIDKITTTKAAENATIAQKEGSSVKTVEKNGTTTSSNGNNQSNKGSGGSSHGSSGSSGGADNSNNNKDLTASNVRYEAKKGGIYLLFDEPVKKENVKTYEISFDSTKSTWEAESGFDVGVDLMYEAASLVAEESGTHTIENVTIRSMGANGKEQASITKSLPFTITVNGEALDATAKAVGNQINLTANPIDPTADYMLIINRIDRSNQNDQMGIHIAGAKWKNGQYAIDLSSELDKKGMFADITNISNQLQVRLFKITKVSEIGLTISKAQAEPIEIEK